MLEIEQQVNSDIFYIFMEKSLKTEEPLDDDDALSQIVTTVQICLNVSCFNAPSPFISQRLLNAKLYLYQIQCLEKN